MASMLTSMNMKQFKIMTSSSQVHNPFKHYTCSKSRIEALEKGWNIFKVNNKDVEQVNFWWDAKR